MPNGSISDADIFAMRIVCWHCLGMPYENLPETAFWAACRAASRFAVDKLYVPKFAITRHDRIATIGSCFAQHIGRRLRASGALFLDMERAPFGMTDRQASAFGYGLFSARYGNVYTPRQLRDLAQDSRWRRVHRDAVWAKDGRYFDALRPGVEPDGLATEAAVRLQRYDHLHRVARLFRQCDILIVTLGLTEYWAHRRTGRAYATCPGVIAGEFDPAHHVFRNASYVDAYKDVAKALKLIRRRNRSTRVLLTVSPVPLTATATGAHALSANTYSKATLRAVAGDLAAQDPLTDYFPAFEIISARPGANDMFEPNLRQVSQAGVDLVMDQFFAAHPDLGAPATAPDEQAVQSELPDDGHDEDVCEELLLDAMRK